jgi:hypothetical protein
MTALTNKASDNISGKLVLPNGNETTFTAVKTSDFTAAKKDEKKTSEPPEMVSVTYPNVGFGLASHPKSETLLFKNATVWTSEEAGILENTDVLIKDGKI